MPKRSRRSDTVALLTIAVAEDLEHARDCQRLLSNNDIDCVIKPREMGEDGTGVPIMVPEEQAEHARLILLNQNSPGDFYDYGFGDADLLDEE